MQKRGLLLLLGTLMAVTAAFAQFQPRKDYVWARDINGATMTVDGVLNEAVWAKAESLVVKYGVKDGNPSSGWKTTVGTGAATDGPNVVFKFLADKSKNMLYIAMIAKDSSVGGNGWENSDGFDGGIYERNQRAGSGVTLQKDIFITWVDSSGKGQGPNLKGGDLPSRGIVKAAYKVLGIANSDTGATGQIVADTGWVLEMSVSLDSLGYNANTATTDAIQATLCVWDGDWLKLPRAVTTKAWFMNEWGNNGGGSAGRILVRNDVNVNTAVLPAYAYDLTIPNAANFATPTIDGNMLEDVWNHVPSVSLQFGNNTIRNAYPGIGPDRSGGFVPVGPATPIDPGLVKVKMFFKGDILYVGADVTDASLVSANGDDKLDALQVNMTIPTDSLRDANVHSMGAYRFGFAIDSVSKGGSSAQWDAPLWITRGAIAYGVHLKPGSTINTPAGAPSQGYQIEASFDLTKLGYAAGQQNKVVALGLNYHDYDLTTTDTSAYRTWFFREWPWASTPAFALLDNSTLVTGIASQPGQNVAAEFRLLGNYPNPFNPSTKIQFTVSGSGLAHISVYNVLGQLLDGSDITVTGSGLQEKTFDAARFASGVYYYRIEFTPAATGAKLLSPTKAMVLIK
jgi:hypothetical protein